MFFALEAAAPTATQMETVTGAMSSVFELVGSVVTYIIGQPILLFLLAAGLVPIGLSLFRQLKHTAG